MSAPARSIRWLPAFALAACSSSAGPEYAIEVLGSESALATFELAVEGFADEGLAQRGSASLRTFRRRGTLALLETPATHRVLARRDGNTVGEVSLTPFVCALDVDALRRKHDDGWEIVETHQLFLNDDSTLAKDTDLDRRLDYACSTRLGDDGEGVGRPSSTPAACAEPDRKTTAVTIETQRRGTLRPKFCEATFTRLRGMRQVGYTFSLPLSADETFSLQIAHCLDPEAATLPLTLTVGEGFPLPDCPLQPGAQVLHRVNGPTYADVRSGTWTIDALEFRQAGRFAGDLDLELDALESIGTLHVNGRVELPLLRL